MPFKIIRNDITKLRVDAIVNAANTDLAMGGGVCGAIFKAAGATQLQAACDKLAPIKTGEAVITPGFGLSAKFVIHAAGPVYRHWNAAQNEELLRAAYTNSLKRAVENECESVAFPLISSGVYGYPKADALAVANATIRDFLADNDLDVSLVVYDRAAFEVSEKLLGAVASYIDEHYVEENHIAHSLVLDAESVALDTRIRFSLTEPQDLENAVGNLDEPFTATLLRL
ncbi:MAG: macro domain-containing protein, partial [Oscillospiraceae bacterium]|nr:macro domain-containing protein [Oscillospiraceae bacterium]